MKFTFSIWCSAIFYLMIASPSFSVTVERLDSIPLAFTLNEGQVDHSIRFTAQGSGCGMAFSPTGTTFLLSRETAASVAKRAAKKSVVFEDDPARDTPEYESFALKLAFVGANENPEIQGEDRLPWNNNYFIGNDPEKWRTDVPNYRKVRLTEVYNGIDLVYYGNQKRVKYDFVVKPGEDPQKILLKYDFGAVGGSLSVNEKGELVVKTPVGDLIEEKPYCYQKINGKEVEVAVKYEVVAGGTYRFRVGEYDTRYDLVIDPELVYSTYLGGMDEEKDVDIAVDSFGCLYITGFTNSHDFPTTPGALITSYHRIFVSKINPEGTALLYSTFLGDGLYVTITVDIHGNSYIAGMTNEENYPTTPNAYDPVSIEGSGKAFVTKINSEGNLLKYSTRLGEKVTVINAIAVNENEEAFVTGRTTNSFPVTPGAYNTQIDFGQYNVFVTKLNSEGSDLIFSSVIGKGEGQDICITKSGEAIIGGKPVGPNYPTTEEAFSRSQNGDYPDIFVTKISADGSKLLASTYIGGSKNEYFEGISVNQTGDIYIAGTTTSTDYPTTEHAFREEYNNEQTDGFVSKLSSDGSRLEYSTYLGGGFGNNQGIIIINDLKINKYNQAIVTGYTNLYKYPKTPDALPYNIGNDGAILTILSENGNTQVSILSITY